MNYTKPMIEFFAVIGFAVSIVLIELDAIMEWIESEEKND